MKEISFDKNTKNIVVKLSLQELTALSNALNETTNGPNAVKKSEFELRIGMRKKEAQQLLKITSDMMHKLDVTYKVHKE